MKRGYKQSFCAFIIVLIVVITSLSSYLTAFAALTGKCIATSLNVRSGAGTKYSITGNIYYGDLVNVEETITNSLGEKWCKITYVQNNNEKSGYVSSEYISIDTNVNSDSTSSDKAFEDYLSSQGFPESYKPALRQLHKQYPKWIFTAQQLPMTWDTALSEQMVLGRSLVHGSALASWKSMEKGAYDFTNNSWFGLDGNWVAASKEIVAYYMDPRNFLDSTYVFMFENLSYNKKIHNINGVSAILNNTFMNGNYTCPDTKEKYSYAQTFIDAAVKSGVSPYHLASRCRNEQGVYGAPQSLGTVKGYENYFNFFNIQAYATSTMTAQEMGCKYAKTTNPTYLLPWTNQYKSILGGAIFVGNGYITKEQDTLYLQKFDVVDGGNGYYYHQYMTCIFGQANEAVSIKNAYTSDVLNSALEFKIPVYKNMPDKIFSKPTSTGDNNNLLKSLNVSGQKISPNFDKYTQKYTLTVPNDVTAITVNATTLSSQAKITGVGKKNLAVGKNTIKIKVTAASGISRTYTITVTRKEDPSELLLGDVDGNNDITVVDALTVLKYNAGKINLTSEQIKRADVDKNGNIDVVDALTILQYVSGKIAKF